MHVYIVVRNDGRLYMCRYIYTVDIITGVCVCLYVKLCIIINDYHSQDNYAA